MKHILIIEDNQSLLQMLKMLIKRNTDSTVVTAETGEKGKSLLIKRPWDLVITDINLPDCSGLELAKLLKKINKKAKVLMITGQEDTNNVIKALDLKVDAYLLKPFDVDKFIKTIKKLLISRKKESQGLKVLAIGAHPDDIEIGCGGTLLNHKKQGDQVSVLTLSKGSKGGCTSQRVNEAKNASILLGSNLTLCNLSDTQISSGTETITIIENTIQQYQPDLIYTHSKNDNHQDHRNVYRATLVASRSIPCLECYQSPSANIDFKPSRFVDVSQQMKKKIELIKCFASQFNKCKYLKQSIIKANAQYWGRFANYSLVEPFEVIRSIK